MSTSTVTGANLYRLELLEQVRLALEAQRIPSLHLKGAAFLDTLYPDLSSREMSDVDVLVRVEDFERAARVIESLGYDQLRGGPAVTEFYAWAFTRAGITLELHRHLCHLQQFSVDYDGLWQRSVCHRSTFRTVSTLCPEDSLLHLALHEAKHAFFVDERSAEDVRRVVDRWQPDWRTVVDRAREWRMTRALYVSLRQSQNQVGTEVPEWVLSELRPGAVEHRILEQVFDLEGTRRSYFSRAHVGARTITTLLITEDPANLTRFVATSARIRLADLLRRR